MEFREFYNPEGRDYDITSNLRSTEEEQEKKHNEEIEKSNRIIQQLWDLIGLLEDVDYVNEEKFINTYGITFKEYENPTEQTVEKVKNALGIKNSRGR